MLEKRQFRILYREFLFNMIDLEVLAAQAYGDMNKLLGQFAALLLWLSAMLLLGGMMMRDKGDPKIFWAPEHSLISLTMLIVGIFAILSWDSALPNRRDVLVLAPLPIRVRTLFTAKVAALATALSLTVASVHGLAWLTWTPHFMPAGSGFIGYLRTIAAYWLTMTFAGAFIFCSLLALQGLAGQLPRKYFLRLSAWMQIGAFCVLLCGYFLEPRMFTPAALTWAPPFWFFGLFHQLAGSLTPEMFAAAGHAWIALGVALVGAAASFLLAYFRTMRKIVEEPDIAPAIRGVNWLPPFGRALDTAITQFSIRTLLRSRQHRVILAFYLGIAFALVTLGIRTDHTHRQMYTTLIDSMVGSAVLMSACVVGVRVVFAMPIDLRTNWIFQMTQVRPVPRYLSASRRALFLMAVLPVTILGGAAAVWSGGWAIGLRHLAILGLYGASLAYLMLGKFRKIPFTCSYLPGKSQANMAIIGGVGLLLLTTTGSVYEFSTFASPADYAILLAGMSAAAIGARWWALAGTDSEEAQVVFEESMPPAVMELNIAKDGVLRLR